MTIDINKLDLKKFEGFGTKVSQKISITRSNSFGFSPAFFRENKIDKFEAALLYFDASQQVIGIKFIKPKEEGSFTLVKYGEDKKKGGAISARSFFTNHKIDLNEHRGKYDYEKMPTDNSTNTMYLLKLEKKNSPTARPSVINPTAGGHIATLSVDGQSINPTTGNHAPIGTKPMGT